MDDLIRRSEAIDELQKEIDKGIPPFDGVQGAIRCGVRLARNIIEDLPSAQPEYSELKREFILMASYIDSLLECSDLQRDTLNGFISRMGKLMPWNGGN